MNKYYMIITKYSKQTPKCPPIVPGNLRVVMFTLGRKRTSLNQSSPVSSVRLPLSRNISQNDTEIKGDHRTANEKTLFCFRCTALNSSAVWTIFQYDILRLTRYMGIISPTLGDLCMTCSQYHRKTANNSE